MVDGEDRSALRPLRPAAPLDGPLAEPGATPGQVGWSVPRPRRPWLRSSTPSAAPPPAAPPSAVAPKATVEPTAGLLKAAEPATAGPTAATPTVEHPKAAEPTAAQPKAVEHPKAAEPTAAQPKAAEPTAAQPAAEPTDAAPVAPVARRRRVPFAHAAHTPPGRLAVTVARATRDWSRRPSGQLTLPGVFLLILVAVTAVVGALLVPATIRAPRTVATDATATDLPAGVFPAGSPPPFDSVPSGSAPVGVPPGGPVTGVPGTPVSPGVPGTGRPADALAGWAAPISPKLDIPVAALQAYGYAELVLAQTNRSCALSWTTLAAIGRVESGHGSANGARLGPDGKALPKIFGLPLDGQGGRMRIPDTDRGFLDENATLDRAIGPMQFIPTTWQEIGADADNDGIKDPHDIDDAALAAGNYLCKGGRNLTIAGDWWNAILSYNDVRRYAQEVYDTANRYGQVSRT